MNSAKSWTGFRIFLRLFDAISSLLLIAVGNTLENVFRGSVMSRVMSSTLRLSCILVIFEVCFASGLSLQLKDFAQSWKIENYVAQ